MDEQYVTISVDKDLEDLIPTYMENRGKELAALRALLAVGDFSQIDRLGHRMKGVGEPYGFKQVTLLGKQIQDSAKSGDHFGVEKCINEYAELLPRVHIVYK